NQARLQYRSLKKKRRSPFPGKRRFFVCGADPGWSHPAALIDGLPPSCTIPGQVPHGCSAKEKCRLALAGKRHFL
ncbi:MAG: hypothetical protein WA161_24905, partial [Pseudomonas sp.]|uniref:hypothetical protein n=1 Tax=Pseudomonas sp. TaxID=306 RepID=UPI003BB55F46